MPESLCICALVPGLERGARVVLMGDHVERRKPSNPGVLATRCLVRSEVEVVGKRGKPRATHAIGSDETPLLLFPAPGAVSIERFAGSERPIALFVPDGSWPQARRMRPHGPGTDGMTRVTLPDLGPSEYRLREEPQPGGLATLEAIGRALRILEGEHGAAVEAAMLAVFREMVARTLQIRGLELRP